MVALLVVLLPAACTGGPGDTGGDGRTPGPSVPAVTTPPASPEPSLSQPVPVAPSPSGPRPADATLTGEVFAGVEQGCTLLAAEDGDYLLVGELARDLRVGDTATVRGRVRTDVASICQQGTPFEVTEVLD